MPNTGNVFPATAEQATRVTGATSWSVPANAVSDNGLDTTCNAGGSGSQYLVARNFGFALPGSAVNGITVRVELSEHSGGNETISVQLQNDTGVLVGTAKTFVSSGTGKIVYTVGGVADSWGATLTQAIVNHANFGVRIWFLTTHDVHIDYVTLAVEYVPTAITVALTGITPVNSEAGTAVAFVGTPPEVGGPFPPGIFPGPIFPGPIFPGTGAPTGDVTVALSSVVVNAAAGTIVSAFGYFVALTGVDSFVGSGTTPAGEIFPGDVFPGGIFPGPIFPSTPEGVGPQGGVGIVVPATLVVPPAVVVNGSSGFVSAGSDKTAVLTGAVANVAVETLVAPGRTFALNGAVTNAVAGLVVKAPGIPLTGVAVNVAVETLASSRTLTAPLTGASANAAAGQAGIFNIYPLAGAVATAAAGFVTAGTDKIVSTIGVAVNAAAGSLQTVLVGVQANASAGTVVSSQAQVLSGVLATAALGVLVPSKSLALTGVAVNAAAGSLATARMLTGVAATAAAGVLANARDRSTSKPSDIVSAGIVVPTRTVALLGVAVNAAAGTSAVTVIGLTGVAVNAQAGFVSAGTDKVRNITGVAVNAEAGTVSVAARSLALTGVEANAAAGTVAVLDRSFALSGVAVDAAAGTATPVADRTAALTGVTGYGLAYYVTTGNDIVTPLSIGGISAVVSAFLDPDVAVTLHGHQVEATSAVGTVGAGADRTSALTGVGITAAASFMPQPPLYLIGVGINASAGSTLAGILKTLPAVVSTASAGFAAKQNDAIVQLTGVSAVAETGLMSVGPPVQFGTNRHTGIRPARKSAKDLRTLDREMELVED